ncbi:carboxymuconolactone decarboxylase family protein [Dactylosporangium sp. NPDC000555]|uniref:carboxymuconolactone decarboxylase family protein n=1 Tax=Dactylosporangium sp. NPDC000555 TaxID=3154260 RepID=UPI003327DB0C
MTSLFARATRRIGLGHIRHVRPVGWTAANGLVRQVYRQMETDFGLLAPPLVLHAASPESLAATWLMLRETLVAGGQVDRAAKEVVAAAVSLANACPYCVDVHGAVLAGLLRSADADAVAADRIDDVADPRLRAIARWARGSGLAAPGGTPAAPFPQTHAPELIGVAVTFHHINRMVSVFLSDSPLPAVPPATETVLRRFAARMMGGLASARVEPGRSLDLLPEPPLGAAGGDDLAWAGPPAAAPAVAGALRRAAATIDGIGARSVPEPVRRLVHARLASAAADLPGISTRDWLDGVVAALPDRLRAQGRLAVLVAVAAYRVTDDLVAEVRAQGGGDAAVVELASWASFAAARHIGAALGRGLPAQPQ